MLRILLSLVLLALLKLPAAAQQSTIMSLPPADTPFDCNSWMIPLDQGTTPGSTRRASGTIIASCGSGGGGSGVSSFNSRTGAVTLLGTDLGALSSFSAPSHQFIISYSGAGAFASAQPLFSDISGSVASTQMPALTGDCTTSAGAVATTCLKTNGVAFVASATTDTTNAANISSGALPAARMPALTGDTTTSVGTVATTTVKVNGVSYPASPSTHQTPVVTASNTVTYKTVPDCQDTTGNHLNYTQSSDAYSCGSSVKLSAPQVTVLTSGSGTYTTPANTLYLWVQVVGGGGGGSASGTGAGAATDGTVSTFGSSLLTANGGAHGVLSTLTGGAGGTATGGDVNIQGGDGGGTIDVASGNSGGSMGGGSCLGEGGPGGAPTTTTAPQVGRTPHAPGAGGGSGSTGNNIVVLGAAGGAGGCLTKIISSPAGTYSYAVGPAGAAGTAGTNGANGGAGAAGQITAIAYFQ